MSAGKDSCGGLLYQYFSSCIDLPVEKLAELAELALTNHGCHRREMKTMLYEFLRGFVREEELGDYKPPDSAPGGGKK